MADFILHHVIPGVEIISPDPLSLENSDTPIEVRFTDALLWMPQGQSVTVNARYDASNQRVLLSANFSNNPVPFAGEQLKLTSLAMQIAVDSNNSLDTSASDPVRATGAMAWEHEIIGRLGITNNRLPFNLSYNYAGNSQSGFQLALDATPASPIDLPRIYAKIESGQLGVDVLPDEKTIIMSLLGDTKLVPNGSMITQAQQFLSQIFGADNVANFTDPPPFHFQQKFRLEDTGLPGAALQLPIFAIFPNWSNNSTPDANTVSEVNISFGIPRFRFQLPDLSNTLPPLELSLRNSSLSFPDLPGFETFNLSGHLNFESGIGGDNNWLFRFEPTQSGILPLPDILQFFLAQFKWLQGALPDLEDVPDLLRLTQSELDWYRQFEALLDGFDPAALPDSFVNSFAGLFRNILDGAAMVPNAPDLPRLFRLAFRALAAAGDDLFGLIWQVWFERMPTAWGQLVALLQATFDDLAPAKTVVLLQKLFESIALNLGAFLHAIFTVGTQQLETNFNAFIRLWVQTLAVALRAVDPQVLANTLYNLLKNTTGELTNFRPLSMLPPFQFNTISAPLYKMRLDVMITALGLQGLLAGTMNLDQLLSFSDTRKLFEHMVAPIYDFFTLIVWPGFPPLDATMVLPLLLALLTNAEEDQESEFLLIQIGRNFLPFPPIPLGILFALVGAVANISRRAVGSAHDPFSWDHLLFKSIEEESSLRVKRLPPPGNGRKYLIFSDIHRDANSDDRGRITFGSIDHFSVHKQLYLDLLNWADNDGYTVIEAGDGEELWFIRDFETFQGPAALLNEVITTHQDIYDKLADMYKRGRYYRMFGNHDSYIRDQPVFDVIAAQFNQSNPDGEPFQLYDHLIIPGVLTMDDGLLDLVQDLFEEDPEKRRDKINQRLIQQTLARIGLDSALYTNKKPLIVTHGHQWDTWNCDRNNLVGKLLANSVGVPVDMMLDPFIDIGGVHGNGNISINLADFLAKLPIAQNFTAHAPSRKFAHKIQHQSDAKRLLIDDIFYNETLTALTSWLAMPLTVMDETGTTRTWSQYLANPSTYGIGGLFEHLFNQIVIGHTHYPQARPFIDIEGLLFGPLADVVQTLRSAISEKLFGFEPTLNFIQTPYYNSGTAGWMEGVIWALEVDEHGVARLLYWTKDIRIDKPQEMDWQIPRMDDLMRQTLNQRKQEVLDYFLQLPDLFGDAVRELLQNTEHIATLPFGILAAFSDELAKGNISLHVSEPGLDQALSENLTHSKVQSHKIGEWLVQLFLSIFQHQADNSLASQQMELTIELPEELANAIVQIKPILSALPLPDVSASDMDRIATALSCVWLLGNRSASVLNRMRDIDLSNLIATRYPVAYLVFGLIALLPLADNSALPFTATVNLNNKTLSLTVTVR